MPTDDRYQPDRIDAFIAQWQSSSDDFDPTPTALVGRILRLRDVIHQDLLADLAQFGLNYTGFHLLVALRRSGPPYQLTPSEIRARYFPMTSGGMVGAIDRLERRRLVRRRPHPADRRGVIVEMTASGVEIVEEALVAYRALQRRFSDSLTTAERETLVALLHKLLVAGNDRFPVDDIGHDEPEP